MGDTYLHKMNINQRNRVRSITDTHWHCGWWEGVKEEVKAHCVIYKHVIEVLKSSLKWRQTS